MSTNELNIFLNSFSRPTSLSNDAWNHVLSQAKEVWNTYLKGKNWEKHLDITCIESYLMLVNKEGKLIVQNESLLNYVKNKEVTAWRKHLEDLAFKAIAAKQFDKADRYFSKALKVDDSRALNYYRRGIIRARLLKNKEALEDFTKAIALNADTSAFYIRRFHIYRLLDLDYKAMTDLNKAIKVDPQNPEPYELRGKYRMSLGEKAGASNDLQKANALRVQGKTSEKELYGRQAA